MPVKKLSVKAPKKRLLSQIKTDRAASTNATGEALKLRVAPECELFALAVAGGDGNKVTVYNRLRAMTPAERNKLRHAVERLDGLLDQVALDLHLERHKSRSKGGRNNHETR